MLRQQRGISVSGAAENQIIFRINDNGLGPELLQHVFLERGWLEYDPESHGENGWNIWWRTSRFKTSEYGSLMPWQWINHYPNCTSITKKDALCRNLRKMRIVHGYGVFNFSPTAFNLPNDYTKFVSEYASVKQQSKKNGTPVMWICKPAESSRGRGIFVFSELSDLQYDCNAVVQQYITDPLLIGGYKFDVRIYVAVPSFHPLQIYVHEEGLVRFSTEKYDLDQPNNVFAHLTNTSINKFSPGYTADKDEVGHGCKWTISQLRRYFLQNNIPDGPLWQRMTNIIILTILMQAPLAPKVKNCFELYGFDILIDNSLKPWLLEVNFSPALSSDCKADLIAKKAMLHDLLDLTFRCDLTEEMSDDGGQLRQEYYNGNAFTERSGTNWVDDKRSVASSRDSPFMDSAIGGDRRVRSGNSRFRGKGERALRESHISQRSPRQGYSSSSSKVTTGHRARGRGSILPKTNTGEKELPVSCSTNRSMASDSMASEQVSQATCDGEGHILSKRLQDLSVQYDSPGRQRVDAHATYSQRTEQQVESKASIESDSGFASLASGFDSLLQFKKSNLQTDEIFGVLGRGKMIKNTNNNRRSRSVAGWHVPETPHSVGQTVSVIKPYRSTRSSLETSSASVNNADWEAFPYLQNHPPTGDKGLLNDHEFYKLKNPKPVMVKKRERKNSLKHPSQFSERASSIKTQASSSSRKSGRTTSSYQSPNGYRPSWCTKTDENSILKKCPHRVGDFFLVFPFNRSTCQLASGKLDPKLVIKELQKQSREAANVSHSQSSSSACQPDDWGRRIWGPIKPGGEDGYGAL